MCTQAQAASVRQTRFVGTPIATRNDVADQSREHPRADPFGDMPLAPVGAQDRQKPGNRF